NNLDCDDYDNTIYQGAPEICYDGIDNDCDGYIDEDCLPVTEVAAQDCGITINNVNTQFISANPVTGAEEYEFRITNGAYSATAKDNVEEGKISIAQFEGYKFNTTYQIAVRAKVAGVWGIFDAECSITTGSPATQIVT